MSYIESRVKIDITKSDLILRYLKFFENLGLKNLILEPFDNKVNRISEEVKNNLKQKTNINLYLIFVAPI